MENIHRILTTYAYNISGSMEDAKDVVQDVIEKYIGADRSHIEDERNYLIKSVVNHAINLKKRKSYKSKYGEWLPDPVDLNQADSHIIKEQTASYSLLVLMEKLNALERAVFILKEGFAYKHKEIADVLDIQTDHSRQLFLRAKKSLKKTNYIEKRTEPEVLKAYINAIANADLDRLESLLVEDIELMADGGSTVKVITGSLVGANSTAKLLQNVYGLFLQDKKYFITEINHQPAVVFHENDKVYNCQILVCDNHRIASLYSIVDPQKLKLLKVR